ncbi:MAG TPA: hypothetical protein VK658_26130 [Chryseolinea sp.]|nr:hypothetical protein [Chryseolinea sp.]
MPAKELDGTCLFNIFEFEGNRSPSRVWNRTLPFVERMGSTLFFENVTIAGKSRFVPLFVKEEVKRSHDIAVQRAFLLFSSIVKAGCLNRNVVISLFEELTLVLTAGSFLDRDWLKMKVIAMGVMMDSSSIGEVIGDIRNASISNVISIRYPYRQTIDSRVFRAISTEGKRFDLILRNRLFFKDVLKHDIILTRAEALGVSEFDIDSLLMSYSISLTEHSEDLALAIQELKEIWSTEGFNPYRTPFPSKWFLFVNPENNVGWWKAEYQIQFPAVKGNVKELVLRIIELLHNLDWWKLQRSAIAGRNVVIPRMRQFPAAAESLYGHLLPIAASVCYSDDPKVLNMEPGDFIAFDAINTGFIMNSEPRILQRTIKFVIPDFLYYGIFPYFLLNAWDYWCQARIGGARRYYTEDYETLEDLCNTQRKRLAKLLYKGLNSYRARFRKKVEESDAAPGSNLYEDFEMTESEVVEEVSERSDLDGEERDTEFTIVATDGSKFTLRGDTSVLLEAHGHLITTRACLVTEHSRFFPIEQITKYVDVKHLAEKMARMPTEALTWTDRMHKRNSSERDVYLSLKSRGLSILESTFNSNYIALDFGGNEDEFFLPRRYSDWEIICDFLEIKRGAEAWNAHKCRSNINLLRDCYIEIIGLLFSENAFGLSIDEAVVESVAKLLDQISAEVEGPEERMHRAVKVIYGISEHIALKQAMTITKSIQRR